MIIFDLNQRRQWLCRSLMAHRPCQSEPTLPDKWCNLFFTSLPIRGFRILENDENRGVEDNLSIAYISIAAIIIFQLIQMEIAKTLPSHGKGAVISDGA